CRVRRDRRQDLHGQPRRRRLREGPRRRLARRVHEDGAVQSGSQLDTSDATVTVPSMAATASTATLTLVDAHDTYADGRPFDSVHYLQSKLALKPDRFTSVESFHDFGRLVRRTAREVDVGFDAHPDAKHRPRVREIVFVDTPDVRLYHTGFILRRRRSYVDGFPAGAPEIVFKYRHSDEHAAAAVDVRPRISGSYRVKFKAQILPLGGHVAG